MPIAVTCDGCGKRYVVADVAAGRRVRCKQCAHVFAVPAGRPPVLPESQSSRVPPPSITAPSVEHSVPAPVVSGRSVTAPRPKISEGRAQPPTARPSPRPLSVPAAEPVRPKPPSTPVAPGVAVGLVAVYLLGHAGAAYFLFGHRAANTRVVRTLVVADVVAFFAVVGPVVWLGVWAGSKAAKFTLPRAAYLRACGVAAVPGLLATFAVLLQRPAATAPLLLGALVAFLVGLKVLFGLRGAGAAVSFVFSFALYGGAKWAGYVLALAVAAGVPEHAPKERIASTARSGAASRPGSSKTKLPPFAAPDLAQTRLERLKDGLAQLARRRTAGHSREEMLSELGAMRAEAERLRPAVEGKADWADVPGLLARAEGAFKDLPSERPDPAVFQPPPAGPDWRPPPQFKGLGGEVSFRQFKFRPPAAALLDLRKSEGDAGGLVWRDRSTPAAEMAVSAVPRKNPRQLRPWVAAEAFMLRTADAQNLLAVSGEGATTEFGRVGGLPFTRIAAAPPPAGDAGGREVKYIALDGDAWLVIDIKAPADAPAALAAFEASARTLRRIRPGEPRTEPFAPEQIAPRLADDPSSAAAILRRFGPAAEAAVAAQLAGSDPRARRAAAKLIGDLATAKSLPALRAAASSSDPEVAAAAQAALRRLAPG